ncbi:hypothetical protein Y032_0012g1619 [Ancylostoma ceylanicum]|uniref:Uncharacterized protein n=1 Tax=Ancylostoma ceylanicum TaxID=53326 RepID=A0A016VD56_9BILA|nr:hypothetical protein Y032_0012g1619 [Ancylostoma ceylanicum]
MNLWILASLLLLDLLLVAGHFEQSTCGKQKKCIFSPVACKKRNDCRQIFSYSPHEDGWVDMEMFRVAVKYGSLFPKAIKETG